MAHNRSLNPADDFVSKASDECYLLSVGKKLRNAVRDLTRRCFVAELAAEFRHGSGVFGQYGADRQQ